MFVTESRRAAGKVVRYFHLIESLRVKGKKYSVYKGIHMRALHNPLLHCDPCHCERSEAPKELKQSKNLR